jgi:hypothetical protein
MSRNYFQYLPNFEYVNRNPENSDISNYIAIKNLFKRVKIREDIFNNLNYFEKYQIIGDERPDNVAFKIYEDQNLDWVVLLANNITNIQSEWPLPQNLFDKVLLEKYGSYENLYSNIHHYETIEVKNSARAVVLPAGLRIQNTWRTNGNFIQVINTKINQIFAGNGIVGTKTVTVTMNNGIKGLTEGSQVLINNVSENIYNGKFTVTSVLAPFNDIAISFTYELPSVPSIINPNISTSNKEEVVFTLESGMEGGNSYYYEFYDSNLESYTLVPSTDLLKAVTNYEYELSVEDKKRSIFILKPDYLDLVFNDLNSIMRYKEGGVQYIDTTLKRGENIRLYQ